MFFEKSDSIADPGFGFIRKDYKLDFATRLLAWFDLHGRHDLPWQFPRSPYQVWVSEIMLQQTQVQTVIPYFERFMLRFPDVETLANASQDEVLAHWAGLGYYARGRNLHRAAQVIVEQYGGSFPQNFEQIVGLPGIGRSTAGAILAQSFNQPFAILDGNVKRVLSRYAAIEGWPGIKQVENQLWDLAEQLLPDHRFADYTQALMDLGATVCKRSRPLCQSCPLKQDCQACLLDRVAEFPGSKPKKTLPIRQTWMLLVVDAQQRVALVQRPNQGIWGGLFSLPEFDSYNQLCMAGVELNSLVKWSGIRHSFSHYHLEIQPVSAQLSLGVRETAQEFHWMAIDDALKLGLPAPIKKLLTRLGDLHDQKSAVCKV